MSISSQATPTVRLVMIAFLCALLNATLLQVPSAFAQGCPLTVDEPFNSGTINRQARAVLFHDDDGDGPNARACYFGGDFDQFGAVPARGVIRRVDDHWEPVGEGVPINVYAMADFDSDGEGTNPSRLFAGGTNTGGQSQVFMWDSSTWSSVGTVTGSVYAMLSADIDADGPLPHSLIVAGLFTAINGTPMSNIARWDGSSWHSISDVGNPSGVIRALEFWDRDGPGPIEPALYVGGRFANAGGETVNGLAKFSAGVWSRVFSGGVDLSGADGGVHCLKVCDPDGEGDETPTALFVGGRFSSPSANIFYWSAGIGYVSGGTSGPVYSITTADFDGTGPQPPHLVVGGSFSTAFTPGNTFCIQAWNGVSWQAIPRLSLSSTSDTVNCIASEPLGPNGSPFIAVGGQFQYAQAEAYSPHALGWSENECRPFATGLDNWVNHLIAFDEDGDGPQRAALFALGTFNHAGGQRVGGIAKWDGERWHAIRDGVSSIGRGAAAFDEDGDGPLPPSLFACGRFYEPDGITLYHIARYRAGQWQPVPFGDVNTATKVATEFDPDGPGPQPAQLYVGGTQSGAPLLVRTAGGLQSPSWESMSSAFEGSGVEDLLVWDSDGSGPLNESLYLCGNFDINGEFDSIAGWNGDSFFGLVDEENSNSQMGLGTFDSDGDGPLPESLFVAGNYLWSNGSAVLNVAQLVDRAWNQVGDGIGGDNPNGLCFATFDLDGPGPNRPVLLLGGRRLSLADDRPIAHVAVWNGQTWSSLENDHRFLLSASVNTMLPFDDDGDGRSSLFIGGEIVGLLGSSARFLARVTPGLPAAFDQQPASRVVSVGGTARFTTSVTGDGGLSFQWLRNGVEMIDDGRVSGSQSRCLTISDVTEEDSGGYVLSVFCPCGDSVSAMAMLEIGCLADFDHDGVRSAADIFAFLSSWFAGELQADVDEASGVSVQDIFFFLSAWFAGCD